MEIRSRIDVNSKISNVSKTNGVFNTEIRFFNRILFYELLLGIIFYKKTWIEAFLALFENGIPNHQRMIWIRLQINPYFPGTNDPLITTKLLAHSTLH